MRVGESNPLAAMCFLLPSRLAKYVSQCDQIGPVKQHELGMTGPCKTALAQASSNSSSCLLVHR